MYQFLPGKLFCSAALLLMSGSLLAQTKHKPKFPNPKLRTSIELGIISAEAKVSYNINRWNSVSLGWGYGYTIAGFSDPKFANTQKQQPNPRDMSLLGDFHAWSSFMVSGSYRYYLRHRGNYLPNGGYLGVLLRYRGAQIEYIGKDNYEMRPVFFYAAQLGHLNYLTSNRLYTDFSIGYGLCINDQYTAKEFAPQLSLSIGWFIGPNKVREDKTTTP
ncbi:hypothetical protein [Edaphocola flava]|uniref:hypothetical protein n=1 Tax=Edaphocola flava TaxID=2499629 RepID=UPI00100BD615|nr:hypothetical protein [Edaphocola flava]